MFFEPEYMIWAGFAAFISLGLGLIQGKIKLGRALFMFVMTYLFVWMALPPFALDMSATWITAIVILMFAGFLNSIDSKSGAFSGSVALPAVVTVAFVTSLFITSGWFTADQRVSIIDLTDHGQKDVQLQLTSQEKALRVTPNLALKRAAELIGEADTVGLASVASLGEMFGNVVQDGKAIWAAPLEPNGFFRWWSSPQTPGYFEVSHVNVMDSRLVEDKPINYGTGFYFSNYLKRHLYSNGYVNYRYGDVFFQIDDEGEPYYVVPMERPQVGMWAYFPEAWAVVHAGTGKIDHYDEHEDLPLWVDRAYSDDVMEARLDDWGCFKEGPWACYFSGVEVVKPTPGVAVTMDGSDQMIYYTGTQFKNNTVEGATSGVATINARTGEVHYYRRAGITEIAAKNVINGAVSNFAGWSSENPVLVQLNGLETYFSVITDGSGQRKGYGLVWQRNRDAFGRGDSVEAAIRAFNRSVKRVDSMTALESNKEELLEIFAGNVVAISPFSRDGNTSFYVRIDTVNDKVFLVNLDDPAEVAVTTVGERVLLETYNSEPGVVDVAVFDNVVLDILESELQLRMNEYESATPDLEVSSTIHNIDTDELVERVKREYQ